MSNSDKPIELENDADAITGPTSEEGEILQNGYPESSIANKPNGAAVKRKRIPSDECNEEADGSNQFRILSGRLNSQGRQIETVQKTLKKYNLKIEGLPSTVKDPFECVSEIFQNGLQMKKIKKDDFRDLRMVPGKNNKKILLLEFVSFDLKKQTLRACKLLKDYKFDKQFTIQVKEDLTIKDRKRAFCALLTKKMFELLSVDYPQVMKAEDEKIKIVRTDHLASNHRQAEKFENWLEFLAKLPTETLPAEALSKKEIASLFDKIKETAEEIVSL